MAVQNSVTVYIDGVNLTSKLVLPVKISELLDERLDEVTLSLRNVRRAHFAPLTPVEIVIRNVVYFDKPVRETSFQNNVARFDDFSEENAESEEVIKYFFVADDAADESIMGKGFYDHDLSLIEVTKISELVVVDNLTYTNDIGRNYTENANPTKPAEIDYRNVL